jgi:hypothetical protein
MPCSKISGYISLIFAINASSEYAMESPFPLLLFPEEAQLIHRFYCPAVFKEFIATNVFK